MSIKLLIVPVAIIALLSMSCGSKEEANKDAKASPTPEEILNIAWRRKWLIVVPFIVAVVCTAFIAHRLPKKYRSETVILVVPQRIPESYVKSTVTTRMPDRFANCRATPS